MKAKTKRLVYGVGINDAGYVTQKFQRLLDANGKKLTKRIWTCPYYLKWAQILERCYSEKKHKTSPTYIGCSICDEWLTFSNFKAWMEQQDWMEKQLDKDLLVPGNKVYSPKTCVFVSQLVNKFITESTATRGKYLIGTHWKSRLNCFQASVRNPFTNKTEYLGLFPTELQGHHAWLRRKLELAKQLAAEQDDPRVAEALIKRYENYGKF